MALVADDDGMFWEAWLPPNLRPQSGQRNWDHLRKLCRCEKGLMKRLPLLLDFVGLDTGNVWLDSSWEAYWEDYPWEENAFEYLKMEWRQAQRLLAELNPLLDRIDQHPRHWLKRLVRVWNAAIESRDPKTPTTPSRAMA